MKKIIIAALFFLPLIASAQFTGVNGRYYIKNSAKHLELGSVRADSVLWMPTVIATYGTGSGSVYVNVSDSSIYALIGATWVKQKVAGSGGGGTTYTGSNGLTLSTADFQLGGTLSSATSIDLGASYTMSFKKSGTTYEHLFNNGHKWIGSGTPSDGGYNFEVNGSTYLNNGTGVSLLVSGSSAIRSAGAGSQIYIDAGSNLAGTVYLRGANIDLTYGAVAVGSIAATGDVTTTSGIMGMSSGATIVALQIKNTASKDWRIENTRTAAAGSLEFTNITDAFGSPRLVILAGGRIGISTIAPTAMLHLPAGTATASTAPLKLTTGTALTTPEDGAIEYHSSHLYFTIGSTRYQLDQQLTATTGTWTPTLTNTTNVAASTAYEFKYTRVVGTEDIYTFSGEVDIDPTTTATLTVLTFSLPVSTLTTFTYTLSGTASDDLGTSCRVAGAASGSTGQIRFTPTDVTNRRFSVTGQFKYIAP